MIEDNESKLVREIYRSIPMLVVSFLITFIAFPLFYYYKDGFLLYFKSKGVKSTANYTGGILIKHFTDKKEDFIRPFPAHTRPLSMARVDLLDLKIKKVQFSKYAPVELRPRINFIIKVNAELKDLYNDENKLIHRSEHMSRNKVFPVFHIYISKNSSLYTNSNFNKKVPNVKFLGPAWKYQIIVNTEKLEAFIYDSKGSKIGEDLAVYLSKRKRIFYGVRKLEYFRSDKVKRDTFTIALPISIVGDPTKEDWSIYLLSGILDNNNPSLMFTDSETNFSSVFDTIAPRNILNLELSLGEKPGIFPLLLPRL